MVDAHSRPGSAREQDSSPLLRSNSRLAATQPTTQPTTTKPKSLGTTGLVYLTVGAIGLQTAWGIETSYGTPFLQSLGISKSTLSFVWLAGPLTGVVVQPIVGIWSDGFQSKWGRRRPFIVGGALATVASLLLIAWSPDLIHFLAGLAGFEPESAAVVFTVQLLAVLMVYVADFAINTLQASLRAIIADCAPKEQQDIANAWLSRISSVGHLLCFFLGGLDLRGLVGSRSLSQFQLLCLIGSVLIFASVGLNVVGSNERSTLPDNPDEDRASAQGPKPLAKAVVEIGSQIIRAGRSLPPAVAAVCRVQFVAWLAWFPFLFYATTYIGHLYVDPILRENPDMSDKQVDEIWLKGTRIGAASLLAYSVVSFLSNAFLPFVVKPLIEPESPELPFSPSSFVGRRLNSVLTNPDGSQRHLITLVDTWMLSLWSFSVLTWLTLFVSSPITGGALIALMGFPWSVTIWAPFAIVGGAVSRAEDALSAGSRKAVPEAGLVFGIHNMFISGPQMLSSFACSIIFALFQKPRNVAGDDSVAWTLRAAGVATLFAGLLTRKYRRELNL